MIESLDIIAANTLVDLPRLELLKQFVQDTAHLPGIIAEVGVYKGGTARLICDNTTKRVLLFDTFEGLPKPCEHDWHKEGDFNDTSVKHINEVLHPCTNYSIYKGVFPLENHQYAEFDTFSFVHLDVDLYSSVKECLDFFAPRMNIGGIIALDDYNEPDCPGAKLAADEWCKANGMTVEPTVQSQAIIRF